MAAVHDMMYLQKNKSKGRHHHPSSLFFGTKEQRLCGSPQFNFMSFDFIEKRKNEKMKKSLVQYNDFLCLQCNTFMDT